MTDGGFDLHFEADELPPADAFWPAGRWSPRPARRAG
jgi:hypothetical protein